MDKVTQINVEGHVYELLAGQAVAGTSSAAAASYVKVVVFEDAVSLISGMMLAVKFANENTAGFSGNKTVYSSDGETFYYDQAMTDLVTLPPVGCYEITLISGEEYSFSAFPVLSVNGVEKPFCNSRGYPTGGDVWKAGDTVTVVYVDDKFIDVSSAVGSGSGITVYPTEQALNEDLPNVEDGALVSYPGDGDGLNDAPLGTVASYLGNTDPSDGKWLICDGRDTTGTAIELETHYPSLYMFLGGTNVLPEIFDHTRLGDIESITVSTSSASQTTIEYDGFIFITTPYNVGFTIYINGTSFSSNVNAVANYCYSLKKGDKIYTTTSCTCKIRYYKNHCLIKATSSVDYYHAPASEITQIEQYFDNGLQNAESYSTTETLTGGKWIDGKPIYRKVFVDKTNAWNQSTNSVGTIQDLDKVVRCEATAVNVSNNAYTNVTIGSTTVVCSVNMTNGVVSYHRANGSDSSSYWKTVTVEYTKTTD